MAPDSAAGGRDTQTTIPPKYPYVLVHGIIANDRSKNIDFWGRIPEVLEENGVNVFFGNTDAWGNCVSNAEILYATIENVLHETKSEKVNIIAHSKGGLDARYLIWKYNYGDKVASLTTISTPHHGAEISDLLYKEKIFHTEIGIKAMEVFQRFFGDQNPDMLAVGYDLTTGGMRRFNEQVVMDPNIYFQSIYTTMENSQEELLFYESHLYIKGISGDNDGLVSEYSARWGQNIVKINGGISHIDIIDIKKQEISGINIPDIYIKLVNDLTAMGF
jgi:triacylglycerol lipase